MQPVGPVEGRADGPGDGPSDGPCDGSVVGRAAQAATTTGEIAEAPTDIEAIRAEGLTARQLRLARRVAQKHDLKPTCDSDAVRQLRLRGIDPFQRINVLDLVVPERGGVAPDDAASLPRPGSDAGETLPSAQVASPMQRRVREVAEIQQDILRRRRRNALLMAARLAFFVALPGLVCGLYFYLVATPIYATHSAFLILKADGGGAAPASILGSSPLATAQDAVAVQDYLTSKDAFRRLDTDLGFTRHFSQDWIDPIQRLDPQASLEAAHKLYKRHVVIGFDPTEGIIRMRVSAADPETAALFASRLIQYAEQRVDSLSRRKRENQLRDAEATLAQAEAARIEAEERLVALQLDNAIVDPEAEILGLRTQITALETQLLEKRLELEALLDNPQPNAARVAGARSDIDRLNTTIAGLRAQMNAPDAAGRSLAEVAAQMQLARADLATRDLMLGEALAQLSATRREGASQVRYLTTSVEPLPPQDPAYPRKFENTVLSFLIFAGIYLRLSLTASILREQVSA